MPLPPQIPPAPATARDSLSSTPVQLGLNRLNKSRICKYSMASPASVNLRKSRCRGGREECNVGVHIGILCPCLHKSHLPLPPPTTASPPHLSNRASAAQQISPSQIQLGLGRLHDTCKSRRRGGRPAEAASSLHVGTSWL